MTSIINERYDCLNKVQNDMMIEIFKAIYEDYSELYENEEVRDLLRESVDLVKHTLKSIDQY